MSPDKEEIYTSVSSSMSMQGWQ